ncbi:MAG TPA: RdgB/HAM1 family non-canonical purine NTP pyrophosphatase [Ignavibacteria bacterium]|nr:RdgB/HAM1 family non-canonical purine NTP pyrophosphatase [Ignavibacteria bacterium]
MNKNKLIIASNNNHKISELRNILSDLNNIDIRSLRDENIFIEVDETGGTLEENAYLKASEIHQISGLPVIADDTGLFVDSLNGNPGVHSARYAGENSTYKQNCVKLISELNKLKLNFSRAEFKTVICFINEKGEEKYFEGIVKGKIITEFRGENGFGYDPLFIPDGFEKTFAELSDDEKNNLSHRAMAVKKFAEYFKKLV